jgi:hypothetical protein
VGQARHLLALPVTADGGFAKLLVPQHWMTMIDTKPTSKKRVPSFIKAALEAPDAAGGKSASLNLGN